MICPECKNTLTESITFKKRFFILKYKVYSFFCGSCNYEKTKEIRISKEDFLNSLKNRSLKAWNTKTLNTDKSYSQSYKNIVEPFLIKEKEDLKIIHKTW